MRNVYFEIALKKPYLIVNYDQTSAAKINEKGDSKEELSRIDKLLSYKLSDEGTEGFSFCCGVLEIAPLLNPVTIPGLFPPALVPSEDGDS